MTVAANETVADTGIDLPLQAVELQVGQDSGGNKLPLLIGGMLSLLLVAGAGAYMLKQKMMSTRLITNGQATPPSGTTQKQNAVYGNPAQSDDFLKPNPPAVSTAVNPDDHSQNRSLQSPDKQSSFYVAATSATF